MGSGRRPDVRRERTRIPVRCDECNTQVAELRGELLVIKSRHFGEHHVSTFDVRSLAEQCGIIAPSDQFSAGGNG